MRTPLVNDQHFKNMSCQPLLRLLLLLLVLKWCTYYLTRRIVGFVEGCIVSLACVCTQPQCLIGSHIPPTEISQNRFICFFNTLTTQFLLLPSTHPHTHIPTHPHTHTPTHLHTYIFTHHCLHAYGPHQPHFTYTLFTCSNIYSNYNHCTGILGDSYDFIVVVSSVEFLLQVHDQSSKCVIKHC